MDFTEMKALLTTEPYSFLRTDPHLGDNIILLGLGGSYAYGTNVEGSDIDIRGCALNSADEILLGNGFEQVVDHDTDTTVYSFNKLIKLLTNCNPNTIELLGLKKEHYLRITTKGQQLIDNADIFLSKRAIHAFGGYAYAQLRRLDNKAARLTSQREQEQHILNSINNAQDSFAEQFFEHPDDTIRLYIDQSEREGMDAEIFMDVNLTHYPLRDYKSMWSAMNNIVKEYSRIGGRNKTAIEKGRLAKHMMHLVRLYFMCLDILEDKRIVTYREKEHDLLMDIRHGKYLDSNRQPTSDFFDLVEDLQSRMAYAKKHTELPEKPDQKRIDEFVRSINMSTVAAAAMTEYFTTIRGAS
jgi:predicted nucleotidyltransferase